MSENDVLFSIQEIKSGRTDAVREFFGEFKEKEDELVDNLQREGIKVESAFIDERDDGEYLYYYIECDDTDTMFEVFAEIEDPNYDAFEEMVERCLVGGLEEFHGYQPEMVFHTEVPNDR